MKRVLLLLILISSFLFAADKIINIKETIQRKDQWCWSGCSTPILNYYGESVSQGEIVQYAYGDSAINQWNWLVGHSAVEYQGKTYYPHGINEIMDNWNTDNKVYYSSLSASQWQSEVDKGYPFVIRWGWNSGGGHFVVGMGYLDNGNYQIMDPWFGCGYTIQSYNWVKTAKGGQGNWTHSLTTERELVVDSYDVLVAAGSGDGVYKAGESVTIIADEAPSGYIFDKWNGNTDKVAGTFDSIATFTMIAENLTFTAIYKPKVVIDTSKLSKNLLFIAGWEGIADSYGSFAKVDTSKIASDTIVHCSLKTVKDNATSEKWAWSQVSISNDTTYDKVDLVKITYKSSEKLLLTLVQNELSLQGVAYGYMIPATSGDTTLYIPVSLFEQPETTPDSLKKNLLLSEVSALTLELQDRDVVVPFSISELQLNGYVEKSVSTIGESEAVNEGLLVSQGKLLLSGISNDNIEVSIYSALGREVLRKSISIEDQSAEIVLPRMSQGIYLVKVQSSKETLLHKFLY